MRLRHRPLAATALLLLACTVTACGAAPPAAIPDDCTPRHRDVRTLEAGTLSVWVYVSPPGTLSAGDTFSGIEPEIVSALAAMECLEVQMQPVAGAAMIAGLQSERADVGIGAIYHTPERAATLNLSAPVYQDGMAVLAPNHLDGTIEGLRGTSVGVVQGTSWIADLQKVLGADAVHVYQATDGMVTDLRSGRLGAAVLNSGEAAFRAGQTTGMQVVQVQPHPEVAASQTRSNVVLAVRKGAPELAAAFDEDIATLVDDGTVAGILGSYGVDPALAGGDAD
jgi:polar amino acid transport system substrate-binding protein